jgi:hypothetical protein
MKDFGVDTFRRTNAQQPVTRRLSALELKNRNGHDSRRGQVRRRRGESLAVELHQSLAGCITNIRRRLPGV